MREGHTQKPFSGRELGRCVRGGGNANAVIWDEKILVSLDEKGSVNVTLELPCCYLQVIAFGSARGAGAQEAEAVLQPPAAGVPAGKRLNVSHAELLTRRDVPHGVNHLRMPVATDVFDLA